MFAAASDAIAILPGASAGAPSFFVVTGFIVKAEDVASAAARSWSAGSPRKERTA